ncbi:MAG: DsbA family protein [Deltaproteobacteria bacterium]|nr:DsbA family protein [Deltaproteobacteria bacterium]
MIFAKRLKGKAISAWLGPTGDAARRAVRGLKERITSTPKTLDVYFDPTDPWSYLTGQAVQRLIDAYPVDFTFHVITPPASDVDPAPPLRAKYSLRDAQALAEYWDLEFPGTKEPDGGMVRDIGTALVRERPPREQLAAAMELAHSMWKVDKKNLVLLLGKYGQDSHGAVAPIMNTTYGELRKAGHYQGAMIRYDGEWYWGIDRLPFLERAIAKELGTDVAHVVTPRPESERGPLKLSDKPLTCEMYFSFRSPYSYIALAQIENVLAPYGVPLVLKQVAPMVSRGLPVPQVKRLYIVRDAKREADRLGLPFGEICDPLGPGVDHCLAVQHWANQQGAGLAFARSAMSAIWSEARDPAEYTDLRYMVERANLPWEGARASLEDKAAPKQAADNAADLNGIGLWGVPSFRCGDFVTWGQDRLPLLADRLRRHKLATG